MIFFRAFRDNWLSKQNDGPVLIEEYYKTAPLIVEKINADPDRDNIYASVWEQYLSVCIKHIEQGRLSDCKEEYIRMVNALAQKYL